MSDFFQQNGPVLSEVFLYMERSKDLEKICHNRAKRIHLPEGI